MGSNGHDPPHYPAERPTVIPQFYLQTTRRALALPPASRTRFFLNQPFSVHTFLEVLMGTATLAASASSFSHASSARKPMLLAFALTVLGLGVAFPGYALDLVGFTGITGPLTNVYPWESPGGWQLLGRCPVPMFDLALPAPVLLAPGDRGWLDAQGHLVLRVARAEAGLVARQRAVGREGLCHGLLELRKLRLQPGRIFHDLGRLIGHRHEVLHRNRRPADTLRNHRMGRCRADRA